MIDPCSILLPYQAAWKADNSRFKAGNMSRQIGKSFGACPEIVEDCIAQPKTEWTVLSAGERQAVEFMRKIHEWAEAYQFAIEDYEEVRDQAEAVIKHAETRWPNGSIVRAIPANPDTARGYASNLLLDEFAFHEKPDDIWRAVYPMITNPMRGEKKIRVISTPNGQGNKFHEIITKLGKALGGPWSIHQVNIYEAVKAGLKINIEELRKGLNDPEGWAQEFECQFIDAFAVLLSYELLGQCESQEASWQAPADYWTTRPQFPRFMGIDFARKKDLTVAWTFDKVADLLITREVFAMRGKPTHEQMEILAPRMKSCRRVSLDYTGVGVGFGDEAVRRFGEFAPKDHRFGKVELCQFNVSLLTEIFPSLRMGFESRSIRIPFNREIREDLHAVHRTTTPGNKVTYKAPLTKSGHADRAFALALANRAASFQGGGAIEDPSVIRQGGNSLRSSFRPQTFRPR